MDNQRPKRSSALPVTLQQVREDMAERVEPARRSKMAHDTTPSASVAASSTSKSRASQKRALY